VDLVLIVLILALNVLIGVWNCYAVGSAWKDTMALGGWFNKLVLWSAVVQSGVGFSMPILLGLAYLTTSYLTTGEKPSITPEEAAAFMQGIFSMWYVAVILPILGSGLAIWAHSLRMAYQRRDFASIATAGWNTFAQIHNTVSAVNNLGGALGNVGELFKIANKGSGKNKLFLIAIALVVTSLVGGFLIAFGLVRYFARMTESRIEEYAAANLSRQRQYA
jgi:hypothetical protein